MALEACQKVLMMRNCSDMKSVLSCTLHNSAYTTNKKYLTGFQFIRELGLHSLDRITSMSDATIRAVVI